MAEFFSFLKFLIGCSSLLFLTFLVLLALPQSRLRTVGLEVAKYAVAACMVLLVPVPVDILPDAIPGIGWLDDIGYLVAAVTAVSSARKDGKTRRLYDEAERAELRRRAEGGQP